MLFDTHWVIVTLTHYVNKVPQEISGNWKTNWNVCSLLTCQKSCASLTESSVVWSTYTLYSRILSYTETWKHETF